ncbi:MAG TPA: hypothetical protein VJZ71_10940 [Phycisphaerae bacterium]|nr:hypothetical protein [Phycisphaerae bacterium]
MNEKGDRTHSRRNWPGRQSSAKRVSAIVEVAPNHFGDVAYSSPTPVVVEQLVSEAMSDLPVDRSGFVAIALASKQGLSGVLESRFYQVRTSLRNRLWDALRDTQGSTQSSISWRDLWIDVSLQSDYLSAERRAANTESQFSDAIFRATKKLREQEVFSFGPYEIRLQLPDNVKEESRKEYEQARNRAVAMCDKVRIDAARLLEPALAAEASRQPQRTYDEKKTLAKWVNAELRRIGLAIRCPRTGRPSLLLANAGGQPGIGRFHLEHTDAEGRRHRSVTSVALPELKLMPDELTRAPYGERTR